jgi:hypothetical protein
MNEANESKAKANNKWDGDGGVGVRILGMMVKAKKDRMSRYIKQY